MHHPSLWRIPVAGLALVVLLLISIVPVAASAPGSDEFDNATTFSALPFTDTLDTTEATNAFDDPNCAGNGPTVWYMFTPTETGDLVIDTFGSDYDTTLSLYIGSRGALTQLACNDDSGSLQSRITFTAHAGETYALMIGAYAGGPGGHLVFSANALPGPVTIDLHINQKASVYVPTGVVTLRGTVTCSRLAYIDLFAELRQRNGAITLVGYASSSVSCDGATPWSMVIQAQNGMFRAGPADVDLTFNGYDPVRGELVTGEASNNLRLKR